MTAAVTTTRTLEAELERARSLAGNEPSFVTALRRRGAGRFLEDGFPTPRLEEWRFTNLKRIAETRWVVARGASATPPVGDWCLPGAHRFTLVDGLFAPELSDLERLPPGVVLTSLADALERCPELVEPHLGLHGRFPPHPVEALNAALFTDGVFLWLPSGAVIDDPIQLLFVTVPGTEPMAVFPRTLVVAGSGSSVTVVSSHTGVAGDYLSCPVSEIVAEANASLRHCTLQEEGPAASELAVQRLLLGADATLASHWVSVGGELVRADVQAVIAGAGADLTLDGLYLADGAQHVDSHLLVRHATPHGTSRQLYKGVLGGRSRGVFNGRIVVDKGAQKTDARQSNRNLLLSDHALVNSNPQLEILADDVRCTHGSAIGRLDEDAVFYLRSRGLERAAAESLLTYAFAAEVLERIPVAAVRERARRFLLARLEGGRLLEEAS